MVHHFCWPEGSTADKTDLKRMECSDGGELPLATLAHALLKMAKSGHSKAGKRRRKYCKQHQDLQWADRDLCETQ